MPRPARNHTNSQVNSFNEFVRLHHGTLTTYVARVYADQDAAAVVAAVFAVAWRRFRVVPGDQPEQWLKATARNIVFNMRRGDSRWSSLQLAAREGVSETTSAVDDDRRLEAKVVAVSLAALSADDQMLLRLQAAEEPSSEELGAILGISAQAARTRLSRARQRLHDACVELVADAGAG